MDAKEGFLEKEVLTVAKEGWEECEKGMLGLLVWRVVAEPVESMDADDPLRV